MDFDCVSGEEPLEVCTKKPFNHSHEIHCNLFLEKMLELSLYRRIFWEVDEIVNVQAKSEWNRWWGIRGVGRVNHEAGE